MGNTYISVFGNNVIPPSESSYAAVSLTADTQFQWPELAVGNFLLYDLLDVSSTGAYSMLLPDASVVSDGRAITIKNLSAFTVTLKDAGLNTVGTLTTGQVKSLYLTDNTTVNGVWGLTALGVGTTLADAAALAGDGLTVNVGKLAQAAPFVQVTGSLAISLAHWARILLSLNTGFVLYTLPTGTATYNNFFFQVANQGTGTLVLSAQAGQTIDGASSKSFQPGESAIVAYAGGSSNIWVTVGYGRSTQFQFTKLVLDISTGAPFNLTSTQAQNKLMQFIGTATGAIVVTVPQIVAVYYLECSYAGAFPLTIQTAVGTGVTLGRNDRAIVYCDGINIVNAQTTIGAANLSGGVAGSVVYQVGPSTTGFTAAGAAGQPLVSGGAAAPTFYNKLVLTAGADGPRIKGDFSSSPLNTRVMFETNTGASTTLGVNAPSGGSGSAVMAFSKYLDSTNTTDTSFLGLVIVDGVGAYLESDRFGVGAFLDLIMVVGNGEKFRIAADATGTFTFKGTAPRITGDFSNATLVSRLMLQSSTVNGATDVGAVPNGTSTTSGHTAYNAADPTNATTTGIQTTSTQSRLVAGKTGSGTYKPLALNVGGADVATYSEAAATLGNMTASAARNSALIYTISNLDAGASALVYNTITSNAGSLLTQKASSAAGGYGALLNSGGVLYVGTQDTGNILFTTNNSTAVTCDTSGNFLLNKATGGLGYGAGAGGTVTQGTSRTTAVTLNKPTGDITLFTALGSAVATSFVVNNNLVGLYDVPTIAVRGATNKYITQITNVVAGASFEVTFFTTGGVASDTPIFHFNLGKGSIT